MGVSHIELVVGAMTAEELLSERVEREKGTPGRPCFGKYTFGEWMDESKSEKKKFREVGEESGESSQGTKDR